MFINYAGQGGKRTGMQPVTGVQPGVTFYASFKNVAILNYLEVPVMAKWEWGHKWKYYADFGPYVGFLLSAKQKTSGSGPLYYDEGGTQPVTYMSQPVVQSFDANTDVKSDLHSVNFGLTGGAGIIKKICSNSELVFDIRAADGLVSIQKDTQADGKSHTGGLFVTLGYALSLKK